MALLAESVLWRAESCTGQPRLEPRLSGEGRPSFAVPGPAADAEGRRQKNWEGECEVQI